MEPTAESDEASLLRYVLYARKSSEDAGAQAKSLPDQINDCLDYAENKGIVVVETLRESRSAKVSGRRPVFAKMLKGLEAGKYDGIIAWHPDRLARNSLEAGMIVDMVDNGKIKDLKFPTLEFTNDSSGKLLLNIMFVCQNNIPNTSQKAFTVALIPILLRVNLEVCRSGDIIVVK